MSEPTPPTDASGAPPDAPEANPSPAGSSTRLQRAKDAYDLVSDVLTPQTLFILLAAAIIAITGLLGGWNTIATAEKALPTVAPSATATASPFALSLDKGASFSEMKEIGLYPMPKSRYVMVSVRATNLTKAPVSVDVLGQALTPQLDGRATLPNGGLERPRVFQVTDGQPVLTLQPGLPYHLAVVWRQDSSAPAPGTLQVDLNSATFRISSIDASTDWRDPEATHSVTISIKKDQG